MSDSVNMSLDEIIKKNQQNRTSRSRGRGGNTRGRGGGRGGGRGRGRGNAVNAANGNRSRSQTRAGTPGPRQGRSRSQGRGGRSQSRSQSRARSRSRQRRPNSRARSASRSRSQLRGQFLKGQSGFETQNLPLRVNRGRFASGRIQNRLRRTNSFTNMQGNIHSRLGVTTRRGGLNLNRTLAIAKRGIAKRGRGQIGNKYSNVGLRSDQILKEQRQNMMLHNNIIRSQTFTRSRNNIFNAASHLTVSVANDFTKRRRNSIGNAGYLNKQSLAQLNNQFGVKRGRSGPGSVRSMGSNRSNRSYRSNRSNNSRRSTQSRGRGRGARGIGRKFVNKQILNAKLQKEIAAIQGKSFGAQNTGDAPSGINFTPIPASTGQTLHQRFASP